MVRWADIGDMSAVRALWKQRFGDSEEFLDFFFTRRARPEYTAVFDEGGIISSALHVYPISVHIREKKTAAVMLCGVCTDKEYEGRGRMGACLSFAIDALSKAECALILQKPVDFAIYKSFGFCPVNDSFAFSIKGNKTAADKTVFIEPHAHLKELCQIYSVFTGRYSTAVYRDEAEFFVKICDYLADSGDCRAIFDINGSMTAYCFLEHDDSSIALREMGWIGEKHGIELLSSLSALSYERRLDISARAPLCTRSIIESTQGLQALESIPFSAAAVGNIPLLLKTAFDERGICVHVQDPKFAEHNGTWTLDGKKTDLAPDFKIKSGALTQLACGYISLEDAVNAGQAEITDPNLPSYFDRRFPAIPCFCWDEY